MRARLRVRSAAQEVFLGGAGRHRLGRGRYKSFLREFLYGDVYVYRDMLRETIGMKTYLLEIDIDHLLEFDDVLTTDLLSRPAFHLPLFETAVGSCRAVTCRIVCRLCRVVPCRVGLLARNRATVRSVTPRGRSARRGARRGAVVLSKRCAPRMSAREGSAFLADKHQLIEAGPRVARWPARSAVARA